jgi:hypothetical protein
MRPQEGWCIGGGWFMRHHSSLFSRRSVNIFTSRLENSFLYIWTNSILNLKLIYFVVFELS